MYNVRHFIGLDATVKPSLMILNHLGGHQMGFSMRVQKGVSRVKEMNSYEKVKVYK